MLLRLFLCLWCWMMVFAGFSQNFIHVNQLGYTEKSVKHALITDMDAESFTIRVASTNQVVFSGHLEEQRLWTLSGENIQIADFSRFKTPGRYYVQIDSERSYPFSIGDSLVYDTLAVWSAKAFYLWRASCEIEPMYSTFKGTSYARKMGHPDSVVYVHYSVANEKRHVESELSATKGWYDSGDYSKYVVNASYAVAFLGMAYEAFPEYYNKLYLNIPESGNDVPDILNELKWELDWMMSMFDNYDNGVYVKLSSLKFAKLVMPDADLQDRYMIGKSTASALDFASSMALASRLYAPYEKQFPGFSKKALELARKAYRWALKSPSVSFENPSDVSTGTYSDDDFSDEFFMASVQLFITTHEKEFYDNLKLVQSYDTPTWANVNSIGLMELALHLDELPGFVNKVQIQQKAQGLYDNIYKLYYYSVGKLPLKRFEWGCNGYVAANGAILGLAYQLTKDKKYLTAAHSAFDYLLGRNSLDYCFITRFGSRYPKRIHDRRSHSDGITMPLPGYLVGGPNLDQPTDCGQSSYPSSIYPARAYLDEFCSFSTNEIAINWNAPFVMLVGAIIESSKNN